MSLTAWIFQIVGSFQYCEDIAPVWIFMSFRGDPDITHEYYIKSDNVEYKIYIAEGVNYMDYSGPEKQQNCLHFSFLECDSYLPCLILIFAHLLEA